VALALWVAAMATAYGAGQRPTNESEEKRLVRIRIDGTITFGNFFEFPDGSGPFRFVLIVRRPHRSFQAVTFDYTE
jgi:hypothetical protein